MRPGARLRCVLSFAKPERAVPVEQWKSRAADGAPPGIYASNMADADRMKWRAKLVGVRSGNHQIEIRSEEPGANLVLIVNGAMSDTGGDTTSRFKDLSPRTIKISANGPMFFDLNGWNHLELAVAEAREVLALLDYEPWHDAALAAIRRGEHPLKMEVP